MARLFYTIWALVLNIFGLRIFRTYFDRAMENEDGESLLLGSPFSSFLFSIGIYIIIVNSTLFPRSFRQPKMIFIVIYEFLATAFLLECTTACIWIPIDVLLVTTFPTNVSNVLCQLGLNDVAIAVLKNKSLMATVTYTVAFTFLLLTVHVTDAVDYTIIRDCGATHFATHLTEKLWKRIQQELPFLDKGTKTCRCKVRRKSRSKSRANNKR